MDDIAPNCDKPKAAPFKQLELYRTGTFNMKKFELRQNGNTVLWTQKHRNAFKPPQIDLQLEDKTVLASVKLKAFSRDALLHLGNPDCTDKAEWADLVCENFNGSKYRFAYKEQPYVWIRTHNQDLGASRMGGRDFKLVEEASEQVLVVFRYNHGLFMGGEKANIDFYVELDPQLEVLSLVAILGIEEGIARRQRSLAGAAGGGA